MLITPLIKNDYSTIGAFQGTKQAMKTIFAQGAALVISEDSKVLGVITTHDLGTCHHNLVIDCLTAKPVLSRQHLIPEALLLMQQAHSDVLIVYDGEALIGILHKNDVTDYLCRFVEQQKTLVHSIAHDLKNPLSNVIGVTSLMEHADELTDRLELIVMAQDACNYATGIINDLLASADQKSQHLQIESFELNELLADCADSFKIPLLQKQLKLISKLISGNCFLNGDRIKLKRAFSNLISNAIKFTPSGGEISLVVNQQEGFYLVTITDSGIGIPDELKFKIFDKFSGAQRPGTAGEKSTGMGMFITRQIIEDHGGKIWFESRHQQGTTFYIELVCA